MKRIVLFTSIALVLAGLYLSVGSLIGHLKSVEVCRNYLCTVEPMLPVGIMLVGVVLFALGVLLGIKRKKLADSSFIKNRWRIKAMLSLVLVFLVSWIHLEITKPCSEPVGFMCDYTIGFPVTYWIVTDFIDMGFGVLHFFVGVVLNLAIWYVILSFIFWVIRKAASAN